MQPATPPATGGGAICDLYTFSSNGTQILTFATPKPFPGMLLKEITFAIPNTFPQM